MVIFRKKKKKRGLRGPVVCTLWLISLLGVGERLRFPWSPGRCMFFSCVVKKFAYLFYVCWCSLLFRRGFISGLLCQTHKSDCMFNKYHKKKNEHERNAWFHKLISCNSDFFMCYNLLNISFFKMSFHFETVRNQ